MDCPQCDRAMSAVVATNNLPVWLCKSCSLVRPRKSPTLVSGTNTVIASVSRVQHEHVIQSAYFDRVSALKNQYPILKLIHSVPNGGHRHKIVAAAMQKEGQQPGVPDIHISCARRGYHAMWIEMKTPGRDPSANQLRWKEMLETENNRWVLCYSAEEAWRETCWYLSLPDLLLSA